jgi:hypothetical protein
VEERYGGTVVTFLAFVCFLLILFVAGLPLALFLRPNTDGRRMLLAPILGLCGIVLFTCFLASFGLPGRVIGTMALIVVVLAAATAIVLPRRWKHFATTLEIEAFELREARAAVPAMCAGLFGSILISWPLFLAGCTNYWGFANPDQAFYMTITDHLEHHKFEYPSLERFHTVTTVEESAREVPAAILGLSYLFPMVSLITGIESIFLFGVLCAAMVFLSATSAYVLCRTGLGVSARVATATAFVVALSSVGAQTFYHHSLGALAVAAVCPAGLALAWLYVGNPSLRIAILLAVLLTGMMFCYFPGFAILGVVMVGWFAIPLLQRKLRFRSLILLGGLTLVLAPLVFAKQSVALYETLFKETVSNRLERLNDETILSIDAILTEDFIPSIWGLKTLGLAPPSFLGSSFQATIILAGFGALFTAMTVIGCWKNACPQVLGSVLIAGASITTLYFYRNNGYGVYKLITWLAPLVTIAFSVSCLAFSGRVGWRWLARIALVSYVSLNLVQTVRLADYSLPSVSGVLNNAPEVTLREMGELSTAAHTVGSQPVFAAVPDQVLQRWATVFLPEPNAYYLPIIPLAAHDSDSGLAVEYRQFAFGKLSSGYLLSTTSALNDIVSTPPPNSFIWHNRIFAISSLNDVQNLLLVGGGWYRREMFWGLPGKPQEFRWIRKRAELLILNPVPGAQRLRLRVMAGFGNSSPNRHLALFLNGRKYDDVIVTGQARFLSRPFTATGRTSQLEIAVQEDANMLPRTHPLWNEWVPKDPRRLNLAVFEAGLETDAAPSDSPQPAVDFTSYSQLAHTLYNGIFPDRWLAGRATVVMRAPGQASALRIRGLAPGGTSLVFPLHLRIYGNDEPLGEVTIQVPGRFDISLPLPHAFVHDMAQDVRLGVEPESNCFVTKSDPRCLTVQLDVLDFEKSVPRSSKSSAAKAHAGGDRLAARMLQNSPGH